MKRIIIICTKQYEGYAENIQSSYKNIKVFGGYEIETALSEIPRINPGAVIFLNYYSNQDYNSGLAIEHITKIRGVMEHQIIILSSIKPSTEFIVHASDYGAKVLWGKEIDFDIDNVPETELPQEPEPGPEYEISESDQIAAVVTSIDLEKEPPIIEDVVQELDPELEDVTGGALSYPEPVHQENGQQLKEDAISKLEKDDQQQQPKEVLEIEPEDPSDLPENRKIIACVDDFRDVITAYFVDKFESIPLYINDTTKAVITTSSILSAGGSLAAVKAIIKRIPKCVKLYAIDNIKLNQLIYGEIGKKEDVKFYPVDQIAEIFKDIDGVQPETPLVEITEKVEETESVKEIVNEDKKKFRFNFGSISEKLSNVVEATKSIPRPEIKIPKLQFKDTRPKDEKIEFVERSKTLLVMSPLSTGKTEIASNLAAALADEGFKTALIDLDTSKKGCFYNFSLFEKEHLFILRKVFIHLENGNLEENIENYAYKSGDLYVYTSHRDVEVEISKTVLKSFLRHLKASFDVVVIDVGKDLPKEILENLMDIDGIKKLLVTTQNIEHLNTIPYCYKWFSEFSIYYKGWTLIVNRHIENSGVSDSDIELYFQDPEQANELSFEIVKKYNITDSLELQQCKAKRSIVYSKDKVFSESIRKIIDDWKKGI